MERAALRKLFWRMMNKIFCRGHYPDVEHIPAEVDHVVELAYMDILDGEHATQAQLDELAADISKLKIKLAGQYYERWYARHLAAQSLTDNPPKRPSLRLVTPDPGGAS